jgi:hypothetical protein
MGSLLRFENKKKSSSLKNALVVNSAGYTALLILHILHI